MARQIRNSGRGGSGGGFREPPGGLSAAFVKKKLAHVRVSVYDKRRTTLKNREDTEHVRFRKDAP